MWILKFIEMTNLTAQSSTELTNHTMLNDQGAISHDLIAKTIHY